MAWVRCSRALGHKAGIVGEKNIGKKTQKAACKETIELFSTLITRKIKDIDTLIDSLPSEASTKQLQNAALEKMHNENEKQGDELERQGIKDFILIEKQQLWNFHPRSPFIKLQTLIQPVE